MKGYCSLAAGPYRDFLGRSSCFYYMLFGLLNVYKPVAYPSFGNMQERLGESCADSGFAANLPIAYFVTELAWAGMNTACRYFSLKDL